MADRRDQRIDEYLANWPVYVVGLIGVMGITAGAAAVGWYILAGASSWAFLTWSISSSTR
ncbi:MAG: hypothetical protein R2856_37130 [Caldilineaceae bacterium]